MALETPLWMQPSSGDAAITYSAQQDRAGLLSSVFSREGVLDVDAGQLKLSQRAAGANFTIDVAAGRVAIIGDDASDQGTYLCTSTAVLNIATPAKPASGSRRHRVVARIKDKLHNGTWTTYEWVIEILQDTGSGAPAQPNSAVTLGFINMTSTMTSVVNANLEDARPRASVGTPARTGLLTAYDGVTWNATDPPRLPSWSVNADGWVVLGGWLRYSGTSFTYPGGFGDLLLSLPADIVPLGGGYRDMVAITSFGPQQVTTRVVSGTWRLSFWTATTIPFVQNSTWVSLEGIGWKR